MSRVKEPLAERRDRLELRFFGGNCERHRGVQSVRAVRRHEVRTLHALHGTPEVPDVEKIPDDDLGSELAKVLGARVFAADQGPDGEASSKEVLGHGRPVLPDPEVTRMVGFVVGI